MGALIILGAVLLLIVRYIIHRRQGGEEDVQELAASMDTLKRELQQSADTIIKRLGTHVTKLERLLREAEDQRTRLDTRVADAQRMEWAMRARMEELERRMRDLDALYTPALHQPVGVSPTSSMRPAEHIAITPQEAEALRAERQSTLHAQDAHRIDGDDFAAVLHQSIMRENLNEVSLAAAQQPSEQREALSSHTQPPESYDRAEILLPEAENADSAAEDAEAEREQILRARALLRDGHTVEEVARETGVEIGALRLMQQMNKRD